MGHKLKQTITKQEKQKGLYQVVTQHPLTIQGCVWALSACLRLGDRLFTLAYISGEWLSNAIHLSAKFIDSMLLKLIFCGALTNLKQQVTDSFAAVESNRKANITFYKLVEQGVVVGVLQYAAYRKRVRPTRA